MNPRDELVHEWLVVLGDCEALVSEAAPDHDASDGLRWFVGLPRKGERPDSGRVGDHIAQPNHALAVPLIRILPEPMHANAPAREVVASGLAPSWSSGRLGAVTLDLALGDDVGLADEAGLDAPVVDLMPEGGGGESEPPRRFREGEHLAAEDGGHVAPLLLHRLDLGHDQGHELREADLDGLIAEDPHHVRRLNSQAVGDQRSGDPLDLLRRLRHLGVPFVCSVPREQIMADTGHDVKPYGHFVTKVAA